VQPGRHFEIQDGLHSATLRGSGFGVQLEN